MTPEYAAPEQIRGKADHAAHRRVSTRRGAVRAARGPDAVRHCGETLHELERAVLEQDPDSLGHALRGDLDAIVLKALRKNPERAVRVRERIRG